jgi:predicted ester cyclase
VCRRFDSYRGHRGAPQSRRAYPGWSEPVRLEDHEAMSERGLRESYEAIIAAVSAADDQKLDQLIAPDVIDHNPVPGQAPGIAGIKYWMSLMHDAFPDIDGVVEDVVVEGDKVAGRVTWKGTHRGVLAGVPGTGVEVELQAVHIVRFIGGRLAEWWGTADVFGFLQQVGARIIGPE